MQNQNLGAFPGFPKTFEVFGKKLSWKTKLAYHAAVKSKTISLLEIFFDSSKKWESFATWMKFWRVAIFMIGLLLLLLWWWSRKLRTVYIFSIESNKKMPKKKTGARKKAEKQRMRQKEIRSVEREITKHPCNTLMVCLVLLYRGPNSQFYYCSFQQCLAR